MILSITTKAGVEQFDVCLSSQAPYQYRNIEYVQLANKKFKSYDRGVLYDKFTTKLSFVDLKETIFNIQDSIDKSINRLTLTPNSEEKIFGAGIDYSNAMKCNVTNSEIDIDQEDNGYASMSLELEGVESGGSQLQFDATIPSTLPSAIAYQFPVSRTIDKFQNAYSSLKYGTFGMHTVVGIDGNPAHAYMIDQNIIANSYDTARFEKFVNTQRSVPFIWPDANAPFWFEGQDLNEVLILDFKSEYISFDKWSVNLKLTK